MTDLVVDNLASRRGGRVIFRGLGFTLAAGEALLLTGGNGSGKSSLLRTLALLSPPLQGKILWRGRDVRENREAWHGALGWLGHADGLKSELTVGETLALSADLNRPASQPRPIGSDAQPAEAAGLFGLADLLERPCRRLSAGQRRRVALARLAAGGAPLWLMDEPGAGLDSQSIGLLHAAIRAHCHGGGMAIIATHGDVVLAEAARLDLDALAAGQRAAPDVAA